MVVHNSYMSLAPPPYDETQLLASKSKAPPEAQLFKKIKVPPTTTE